MKTNNYWLPPQRVIQNDFKGVCYNMVDCRRRYCRDEEHHARLSAARQKWHGSLLLAGTIWTFPKLCSWARFVFSINFAEKKNACKCVVSTHRRRTISVVLSDTQHKLGPRVVSILDGLDSYKLPQTLGVKPVVCRRPNTLDGWFWLSVRCLLKCYKYAAMLRFG